METALFVWGISNSQQLSASAWCWVMLATRLGEQEEHWGSAGTKAAFPAFFPFPARETAAAPSLSFLSSALAAGYLQPTPFAFPLQSPSPTLPQLLLSVPRPCTSSPVPVSLSSYGALHLCSPFPNVIFSLLFSGAFAFYREGAMPFWPGASPSCLGVFPHAPAHVSSHSFIAGRLCPVTPACKAGPGATVEK